MFETTSNDTIRRHIDDAEKWIILAAPGFDCSIAEAVVEKFQNGSLDELSIVIDPDPEVCRLGYGEFKAIEILKNAGIDLRKNFGLRIGILATEKICIAYTPVPLLIESPPKATTPNSIILSEEQTHSVLRSIVPHFKTNKERQSRNEDSVVAPPEIGTAKLDESDVTVAKADLKRMPPQKFDLARVVRFYSSHIQFVELSLTGCHINRHKMSIPAELMTVVGSKEIKSRMQATYQLIDSNSKVSSKALTTKLEEIRKRYLVSLGKKYGNVLLKQNKELFNSEIEKFKTNIDDFKNNIEANLGEELEKAIDSLAETLTPIVEQSPPDDLIRQFPGKITRDVAGKYTRDVLLRSVPNAESLISGMSIDVVFKDVTYEMLNNDDFQKTLKTKFKYVDWDKPFLEGEAAISSKYRKP